MSRRPNVWQWISLVATAGTLALLSLRACNSFAAESDRYLPPGQQPPAHNHVLGSLPIGEAYVQTPSGRWALAEVRQVFRARCVGSVPASRQALDGLPNPRLLAERGRPYGADFALGLATAPRLQVGHRPVARGVRVVTARSRKQQFAAWAKAARRLFAMDAPSFGRAQVDSRAVAVSLYASYRRDTRDWMTR